jgi:hypothetical protein
MTHWQVEKHNELSHWHGNAHLKFLQNIQILAKPKSRMKPINIHKIAKNWMSMFAI